MRFKTTHKLQTIDGVTLRERFMLTDPTEEDPDKNVKLDTRDITTGIAMATCLLDRKEGDRTTASAWADRYALAVQMRTATVVELSTAQVKICQEACINHQVGEVCGQLALYLSEKHPVFTELDLDELVEERQKDKPAKSKPTAAK